MPIPRVLRTPLASTVPTRLAAGIAKDVRVGRVLFRGTGARAADPDLEGGVALDVHLSAVDSGGMELVAEGFDAEEVEGHD